MKRGNVVRSRFRIDFDGLWCFGRFVRWHVYDHSRGVLTGPVNGKSYRLRWTAQRLARQLNRIERADDADLNRWAEAVRESRGPIAEVKR